MSFLPQSRPFSYWSFVKLEIHSKFQMEHIKKCLDTMAMSTLGAPLNTTVERDKWICMQWILYKRIFKNLQKVAGARCLPCTSSCSTMQARRSRLQTAWAELPGCTRDSDPWEQPSLGCRLSTCYTPHCLLRPGTKEQRWFWEERHKWHFILSCFVFLKSMDQNHFFYQAQFYAFMHFF